MAHFVLEYSDNIEKDKLALQDLFASLHETAVSSGLFPLKGVRSRAYACHDYRMADGNPAHVFVHLSVLIGAGRSQDERKSASKSFFDVLSNHFGTLFDGRGVALSFELKELEAVTRFNKNNIQDYL